ncbi:MAG: HlyD family secretion protein [Acidobacteria bacterium]|nr:HlyD family secretion protein [Acidobacteriota bacterium]
MADEPDITPAETLEEEHPLHEREPFPEEAGEVPSKLRARGYFKEHPRAKWVVLIVLVAVGVGAWRVWRHYAVLEGTDDAQVDGHIVPVSARIAGWVKSVDVDDNQPVAAGQVLVQLDPVDYQVALQRAQAQLADALANATAAQRGVPITSASASSQLESAEAAFAASERQVEAARAQVTEAQANATKAANDLNRMKQLVARQEISEQQYDAAVAAAAAAQAAVQAAQAQLAAAQSHQQESRASIAAAQTAPQQISVTRARAGAAEATAGQARAQVQQAELNLQYTTLRAPEAGIVDKRTVEPGQVVQPGQPLLSIVYVSNLWVTANYKETQLNQMRINDPAEISVDAYGGRKYRGHVDSIAGATGARFSLLPPENATGNYVKVVQRVPVKIVFEPNQDVNILRPGMSVTVDVKTSH